MPENSYNTTYVVYAAPELVFEALTDPGLIGVWGGGMSVVEPVDGGRFEWFDGSIIGNIISIEQGRQLSFTWKPEEWGKKHTPSKVQILLNPHPAGTSVELLHSDLPAGEDAEKHRNGWIDFVFDPMNDYFTSLME